MPTCPRHHVYFALGKPWLDHIMKEHEAYRYVDRTDGTRTRIKRVLCPYPDCPHPHVEQPYKRYLGHWRKFHQQEQKEEQVEEKVEDEQNEEKVEDEKKEVVDWLDDPQLARGHHDLFRQAPLFPHFPDTIFDTDEPLQLLPPSVAERNRVATIRTWIKKVPLTVDSFRSVNQLRKALKPFIERSLLNYDTLSTLSAGLQHLKYLAYDLVRQEESPLEVAYWLHAVAQRITRQSHYQNQSRVALVILDPVPLLRQGNTILAALRQYWDSKLWPQMALGLRRWSLASPEKTPWKHWCYKHLRPWLELSVRLTSIPVSVRSATQHTIVAPQWKAELEPRLKSHHVVLYWHPEEHRVYRAWVPTIAGKEVPEQKTEEAPAHRPRAEQQRIHMPLSPEVSLALLFFWCMGRGQPEEDFRFYGEWARPVSDLNSFLELELNLPRFNPHNFEYETKLITLARQAQLYTDTSTGLVNLPHMHRFTQLLELGFSHHNSFYPTWHQWKANRQAVEDFMTAFQIKHIPRLQDLTPCQRMIHSLFDDTEHNQQQTFISIYEEAQLANGIKVLMQEEELVLRPSTEQTPSRAHRGTLFAWAYPPEVPHPERAPHSPHRSSRSKRTSAHPVDEEKTIDLSDEDVFEVEQILAEKHKGKRRRYLVRWKGYSEADDTWEPAKNINDAALEEWEERKNT